MASKKERGGFGDISGNIRKTFSKRKMVAKKMKEDEDENKKSFGNRYNVKQKKKKDYKL